MTAQHWRSRRHIPRAKPFWGTRKFQKFALASGELYRITRHHVASMAVFNIVTNMARTPGSAFVPAEII